jgi:hypothetical protein
MASMPTSSEYDSTGDVRAMREEDIVVSDANYRRRTEPPDGGRDEAAGPRLLAALGLDPGPR